MDSVDEVVRRAAPRALGAELAAAEQAEAVARAVVAAETRERSRTSRLRRFLGGAALGIGILGLGVTAAAAAPAVIDWLGWTPDIVAQRSFELQDGSDLGLCEVFIRVAPEYRQHDLSDAEVDKRTEEARRFLTEHDWEPLIASITTDEIQAAYELEVEQSVAYTDPDSIASGATPPPATYSGAAIQVMKDRISDEFSRAGHLRQGVGLEGAAGPCAGATEGPTQ
ncbi:hypothetical protein LQ757_00025 [Agromyces sp. SYSU K20354]|uniref:hypothetical protein n=1 Tax=Agromyces cavernae TaxID=2898659 RepID=UPI001E3651B4|nr:hypothetical protein [Agromyces cavernae]MCD2440654.1 hypothetical protein [Agromyces cavernae]